MSEVLSAQKKAPIWQKFFRDENALVQSATKRKIRTKFYKFFERIVIWSYQSEMAIIRLVLKVRQYYGFYAYYSYIFHNDLSTRASFDKEK